MFKPKNKMSETVNVICYKSKTLANGENPLMLRICKDRKVKYQSLGVSVNPNDWDFQKHRPKVNSPNEDLIQKIILDKELEFRRQILELKAEDKEFTASTLIAPKKTMKTVKDFYKELIEEFTLANKIGNAKIYKDSYWSLKTFTNNKLDIPFSHIDLEFLKGYEKWMRQKGYKETSMSLLFRTLRSTYNKAISAKHAKRTSYPFEDFKVSKFNVRTEKRAVSKDVIKEIMNLDLSGKSDYMNFSRDLFMFSYFCSGINLTDIANLKQSNIVNDRLVYSRQKTGKRISIPLSDNAKQIIHKYMDKCSDDYVFPILNNNIHKTEAQKYRRRKKVLRNVNACLKKIAKMIGIENLTSYVARHSYATVLKNSGVNIALISETLGHSDLKTTQIYLDSFENEQIDKAMENLL